MPPKFQSSFIPHQATSPAAPTVGGGVIPQANPVKQHDILSFLAKGIFALSILAAVGVVGYKWYLNYSIGQMKTQIDLARQEVASGVTGDLIRLNDRITSTQNLIDNHRVLSPIFTFLEDTTPKSVQFTDFTFNEDENGPYMTLRGAAQTYAALANEANVLEKDKDFVNPVFSEIRLDEKGNVTFSVKAGLSPSLISYAKTVSHLNLPPVPVVATSTLPVATTTATTTKPAASTTPKTATSTTH